MSKRHRFLTTRDLHWRWFNALVFGLVDRSGSSKLRRQSQCAEEATKEVSLMKEAALTYVANVREEEGWSENIGLFFHVYGHNSVNSLHLHIVDLDSVGPTYETMVYKNCPIEAVLEVLRGDAAKSSKLPDVAEDEDEEDE